MTYGRIGSFTAHPGKRDDLLAILLQAAEALQSNPDCVLYIVSTADERETIWVSEVWTDKAAHDASLAPEEVRALIAQAMPLIAGMSNQVELQVAGGKGL